MRPIYFIGVAACIILWVLCASSVKAQSSNPELPFVFIIPNFHPASCGWLTDWSTERNYCANSYLAHLDKVRDDANYRFVLSECNNMMAILKFKPDRFAEIKQYVREGRVELPNAFFLEPTINLSGGEALVKMGVEGIRWQQQVMGVRPRYCWAIDVCGTHEQMPQICRGLGLDGLIYMRNNPFGKSVFWSESPDGSRVLTFDSNYYADINALFKSTTRLSGSDLESIRESILNAYGITPRGAPVYSLGGWGDYSLPPRYHGNPTEFLEQWKAFYPASELKIATFSNYVDVLTASIKKGDVELLTFRGGTAFDYDAFWIENPRVKTWYRRDEHSLQAAEMIATVASFKAGYTYPVEMFYHSWLQMLLCMDRNTLWGSAGGMVFEHDKSWDVKDRLTWVESHTRSAQNEAGRKIFGTGPFIGFFNPSNSVRTTPFEIQLPAGKTISGYACETLPDGKSLCYIPLPSMGIQSATLKPASGSVPKTITLPKSIETKFYSARIDSKTGSIASLKLKSTGKELLSAHANVIVLEQSKSDSPGDYVEARPDRTQVAISDEFISDITVTEGPLTITVVAKSSFYGNSRMQRLIRFYKDSPRIDFETDINDVPDMHVVFAEFPLAEAPLEIRKGIPYGFAHTAWSKPNEKLNGSGAKIQPAIRWSDYIFENGSGLALLDRGLTGREINDHTPVIYLMNANATYYNLPNAWLTGAGAHHLEYAMVPHGDWESAQIPEMAWEYNTPVAVVDNCANFPPQSFLETSGNVVVEALRREGSCIEFRLVECIGKEGTCNVSIHLPHTSASLTDMLGGDAQPLQGSGKYSFSIKAQQIVTIRLGTTSPVDEIRPLMQWDELVPENKREALNTYLEGVKGHPPRKY